MTAFHETSPINGSVFNNCKIGTLSVSLYVFLCLCGGDRHSSSETPWGVHLDICAKVRTNCLVSQWSKVRSQGQYITSPSICCRPCNAMWNLAQISTLIQGIHLDLRMNYDFGEVSKSRNAVTSRPSRFFKGDISGLLLHNIHLNSWINWLK